MAVTEEEFRKALGSFATGVTVITVDYEGAVNGMTANAFSSVSLDPPLVLVCVDHRARTHAHLHAKKRFGVNVLAEDQQAISEYYARPAQDHRHGGQYEPASGDQKAAPPGPSQPDEQGDLGGIRPGDQIGGSDEIKELAGREPTALLDDLPLHQREVGRGAAEAEATELEEQGRERPEIAPSAKLAHRSRLRHARKSQGV